MDRQVVMFHPFVSREAIEFATAVLETRWIGQGDAVTQFEAALCDMFEFPHALALNSGTAGLRLALALAGVGPGDEVITTPMTCTATNMPILEQFARPVFVDIQWSTANIDPDCIEGAITAKTKAVMCVHWGGYPCDMDEIHAVAQTYGLPVIEDAAHALGARYRDCPIGSISPFTVFSFQAIKQITTADGGLLCTLDEGTHDMARRARWFGIDRDRRTPSELWPGYQEWPQTGVGYKYAMNNLCASIGLGNLLHWDEIADFRRFVVSRYDEELADVSGVELFDRAEDRVSGNWLYTCHVENRADFHRMMASKGVETSVCHIRNDLHPVFGPRRDDLHGLTCFSETYICLPLHFAMSPEDAEYVIECVRGGW